MTFRHLCIAFVALLALFAVSGGKAFAAADGVSKSCFFCNAPVRHVHGYMSSRGPMPRETTFVHKGETVYVDGPAQVVAYDGLVIAYANARVQAYENATVYYYQRALVAAHGNSVRLFFCPGPENNGWNPKSCHAVH